MSAVRSVNPTSNRVKEPLRKSVVAFAFLLCVAISGVVPCQDISLDALPPVVVETLPRAGDSQVDAKLREIRVTFSKQMLDRSWSPVGLKQIDFPEIVGEPKYLDDGRTWVIDVRLKPGTVYAMWLNNERFKNFRDADQRSAIPYLLVFQTKGQGDKQAAKHSDRANPSPRVLQVAFDKLWDDMSRNYSYFALKQIDREALGGRFRKQAIASTSVNDFVGVLKNMLSELRDGHVWIEYDGRRIVPYQGNPRPRNINLDATLATLENVQRCGRFAVVGTTKPDGFAAVVIVRQSNADNVSVDQAIAFIHAMRDAPGFLVDLRLANGGNETLAQQIASQFCGKETIYARSKIRNGPKTTDFGRPRSRVLAGVNRAYQKSVVCLLGPGCVSSGEGFAKMMACLPHVTTIGEATRGSSGNPAAFQLPGVDVAVWYSRWVDMLPDGTPIEGVGIEPDVKVEFPHRSYREEDPTWRKAVQLLRNRAGIGM